MQISKQTQQRQQQLRHLRDLSNREDVFDAFIRFILNSSSTIYILTNITLLIWLAQTVFSSNLTAFPKSIYMIAPYFASTPLTSIKFAMEQDQCQDGYQPIPLKTFPTIIDLHISQKIMYVWKDNLVFCGRRITAPLLPAVNCSTPNISCQGYCVEAKDKCPITKISLIKSATDHVLSGLQEQYIYQSKEGWAYLAERKVGKSIVALAASFKSRCSNDYPYYDLGTSEAEYWTNVKDCGQQGTINPFFEQFDTQKTSDFLFDNAVPLHPADADLNLVDIGSVYEVALEKSYSLNCSQVKIQAGDTDSYLRDNNIQPQFTQSLLLVSFVLLILQILWLITSSCMQGYIREKNTIVVMLAIFELVVISFIYSKNKPLFGVQQLVSSISSCIDREIIAAQHWSIGFSSNSAFIMVQFVTAIYLGLFLAAYLINLVLFAPYKPSKTLPKWAIS